MTSPEKRAYIAQRRVLEAFGPGKLGETLAVVIEPNEISLGGRLVVRTLVGGDERNVTPVYPSEVTTALERDDVTRYKGGPLVLVSYRHRLVAIATGPPEPPNRLAVLATVTRLGPHGAVEIPGGDGQPNWLLFEIEGAPPEAVTPDS